MRRAITVVAGATLLLLALLATAPASLVDGRIEALSAGAVRLSGATGTVWNGAGELRLPAGNVALPVAWHLDAWPLLQGELRGTLVIGDAATSPASFSVGTGAITLRELAIALPANALLRVANVPGSLVNASGTVGLSIPAMTKGGDRLEGQLDLRWDQAALQTIQLGLRPPPRIALGDLRFSGTGQGDAVAGPLVNAGGDVEIRGSASASANGSMRIDALVRPRPGIDADRANAIGNVLGAFGRADGAGAYRLTWAR